VHGHSRHVGRGYDAPEPERREQDSIRGELRERLRRAVESEQFELAAELRDKIRVLDQ
jgi:protein arginine kinase activator